MTFRDSAYRIVICGTIALVQHTPWKDALDETKERYLANGHACRGADASPLMVALGIGVIAALLWGVHDLCVRRLSHHVDVAAGMLVVLLVGTLCLLPLLVPAFGFAADPRLPQGVPLALTLGSGVLFAVATYCLWRAFGSGPVRIVAPITAAYPIVSLSLAVLAGETVGALAWGAVAVVVLGVAIVASGEQDDGDPFVLRVAIAWAVATAVAFAVTFALGQAAMSTEAAVPVMVLTRLAAVITVVAFMLGTTGVRWPSRGTFGTLAMMGALDVGAIGLVFYAGRFEDASFTTVTASLFGVVTILLAAVFLRERLGTRQWVGVAVTFGAIGVLGVIVE